jgi:hypothetical protein
MHARVWKRMKNNPTSQLIEVVIFRISGAVDYRLQIATFCGFLTVKSIEMRSASVAAVLSPRQMHKCIQHLHLELRQFVFSQS